MGTSTNALVALGVIVEEGFELPWEEWEHHEWWEKKKGNKHIPIPFEVENYCSGEDPMYILCVPGSVTMACRGYPQFLEDLHSDDLPVSEFEKFLKKYKLSKNSPKWLLFSYWG